MTPDGSDGVLQATRYRYASYAELLDDYVARGWTDGLPIVPPTARDVEAFLDVAALSPEAPVGTIASWEATATAEHVAINAVMAGCLPDYFPVVLAAVRALCDTSANSHSTTATLSEPSQVVMVNGPVRQRLGIACGQGCMGPGFRANATIGRALRLVIRNVFGARPGGLDRSAFSTPGRYSFCFGENEEEGDPWIPLHAQRGLAQTDSAVTVFSSRPTVASVAADHAPGIVSGIAEKLAASSMVWGTEAGVHADVMLVVGYEHMRILHADGWSKARLQSAVWDAMVALQAGRPPLRFADPDSVLVVAAGGGGYGATYLLTPHAGMAVTVPVEEHPT